MIEFELPQNNENIIKVVGVGGGGGNAVNHMYSLGIEEVDFIVCNTDMKALAESAVPTKVQLGPDLTKGLGAGAKPDVGREATTESLDEIRNAFGENTQMVFVTAGMGGGTGTGGAPIVAKLAKESGALTVGIVTTPFSYEGKKRKLYAEDGIEELKKNVDTLLIISNDKVRQHFGNVAISEAFAKADDILATAAKCITDVISSKGHIIVDFADVCTVMRDGGSAILGSAQAGGENRAAIAVEEALNSPLLNDHSIEGAQWILLNVNSSQGEHEHTLDEMELIQAYVQEKAGENCDLILGMGYDETLGDEIGITIVATGFKGADLNQSYDNSIADKNKVVLDLENEKVESAEPKNISDKAPALGKAGIDYGISAFELDEHNVPSFSALNGLKPEDEIVPLVEDEIVPVLENDFMELEIPTATALGGFIDDAVEVDELDVETKEVFSLTNEIVESNEEEAPNELEEISPAAALEERFIENNEEAIVEEVMQEQVEETTPAMEEITLLNSADDYQNETTTEEDVFELNTAHNEVEEPAVGETIEWVTKDEKPLETEEPVVEVNMEATEEASMDIVEKSDTELENEYVTIKGITLARKKGSRILTDYELEQEANFELQKRAFDERASKLRSMSYDVNKTEGIQEDEEVPAYVRRNQDLDAHPLSSDETISGTEISENKNSLNSNVSTLNNFLNGNNPD